MSFKPEKQITLILLAALVLVSGVATAAASMHYPTPDEAVQALVDAAASEEPDAVLEVLGPEAAELRSGDAVADAADRRDFLEAAREAISIEQEDDDQAVLTIGADDWPFPIPLVRDTEGWRFDTAAGKDELLNRRIGRNELHTIAIARAYVEAQHEYAATDLDGDGLPEFAQKLMSGEGERDGLYWPVAEGEPESPMGPLVGEAVAKGYRPGEGDEPSPYHGYYYRLLTAQGANAPGGAKGYIVDGNMTDGFALLAYPAEYGNSGVMSFVVNQSGMLFQKNLGDDTATTAAALPEYDPDKSWEPVTE